MAMITHLRDVLNYLLSSLTPKTPNPAQRVHGELAVSPDSAYGLALLSLHHHHRTLESVKFQVYRQNADIQ